MAGPLFYNQGDQDIYNSGTKFLPQEKYRLNKFTAPTAQIKPVPTSSGITNTNAFNNGNDFSLSGNIFGYGSPVNEVNVRTFNPQSLPGAEMPSELGFSNNTVPLGDNNISVSQLGIGIPGGQVSNTYNRARNAMQARGDDAMSRDYPDFTAAEVARLSNNSIQDYRQNYGAQGQYISPYEDSMELPYQGTLGNNEMYPSEKYPNSFMKGKLNRFRNTAGDVMKFAGKLLPFPLNVATQFLPKGDDNGIGGGSYGIAGLSDDKKAAYNALAKDGMLFSGQQGFKTATGKNFQAKNYVPNQIEIYNQMTEQGYKLDEDGNVIDPTTNKVIGRNKNYAKRKFLEASTMYKTANQTDGGAKTDATGPTTTKSTTTGSTTTNDGGDKTPGTSSAPKYNDADARRESYRGRKDGGRIGYFFGGRVNFKDGGLASIL